MSSAKCRVCFMDNIRMYEINKTCYQDIFEKHTGGKLSTENGRPNTVCYLCNSLLQKFSRFLERSHKAEKYLSELNCSGIQISQEQLFNKVHNLSVSPVKCMSATDIPLNNTTGDLIEIEIPGENDEDELEIEILTERNENYQETDVAVKIESVDLDYEENPVYEDIQTEDASEYDVNSDNDVKDITIHEMFLEDIEDEFVDVVNIPANDLLEPRTDLLEPRTDHLKPRTDHLEAITEENDSNIIQQYYLPIASVTLERIPDKAISHLKHTLNGKNKKERVKTYYNCEQCFFVCRYKNVLEKHKHVHDKNREFSCKVCLYRFRTLNNLITHRQRSHKILNECMKCNKTFTKPLYLKRHMKLHGPQTYPCEICDKKYKHRSTYLVHMRTHTGEKPYDCKLCDRKFNDKSNCRKHMKNHTEETPYVCFMCDKIFDVESELKEHVIEHIL